MGVWDKVVGGIGSVSDLGVLVRFSWEASASWVIGMGGRYQGPRARM